MGAVHSLQARVFGDLLLVPIHSQIQSTIRGIIVLLSPNLVKDAARSLIKSVGSFLKREGARPTNGSY